jgi:hypothetical protein
VLPPACRHATIAAIHFRHLVTKKPRIMPPALDFLKTAQIISPVAHISRAA